MGNNSQKEAAEKAFQWYLLGEYTKSKEMYDEILLEAQKNGIKNASLHHDYALLLSNGLKKHTEACTHYVKAIDYIGDDDDIKKGNYCGNYAGILRIMCNYDLSEQYFKKALSLNPDDIHHLSNYADLLREIANYAEAQIKFNHAIRLIEMSDMYDQHTFHQNHSKRPSITTSSGALTNDNKLLAVKTKKNGKRSSIYQRNSALDTKSTRLAVQTSNAFTLKNVGHTYSNYGLLLFSMKKYEESSKLYVKAIEIDGESQIRHYNYARLLYDTQEWNLAITHLKRAVKLSSSQVMQHSATYWLYGRILMEQQQFAAAALYLKNAINIQRNNPLYRCDYILCLIESREYDEAVNEMQNYKKLKIHYLYFDLIYTYFIAKVRGQKADAIKNFNILMNQMPSDDPTCINSKFIYCYYYGWFLNYILMDYEKANVYYDIIVDELRPKHALSAYHYSVSIISKWIKINGQRKKQEQEEYVEDINLNDDDDDNESEQSEYGEEQIKEYKHALSLIRKAYKLNNTIPIIQQNYQLLLEKIHKVIGYQPQHEIIHQEDGDIIIIIDDDEKENDNVTNV